MIISRCWTDHVVCRPAWRTWWNWNWRKKYQQSDILTIVPSCKRIQYTIKEESRKAGLMLDTKPSKKKTRHFNTCLTCGEEIEMGTDFVSFGSKISANGHCSSEIKRHLLLDKSEQHTKEQTHAVHNGVHCQSHDVSSIDVWMWRLGYLVRLNGKEMYSNFVILGLQHSCFKQ